ncbi:hypothetical protein BU993_11885 [Flavobacterium columnare]|nr:hypothetical protein BU993_11885 [Flavobacterium columnare]
MTSLFYWTASLFYWTASLFGWTTSLFYWTTSLFYSIKIKKDSYWQVFADKNDSQMLHVLKK